MLATVKLKELIEGKEFGEISEVYANNFPAMGLRRFDGHSR